MREILGCDGCCRLLEKAGTSHDAGAAADMLVQLAEERDISIFTIARFDKDSVYFRTRGQLRDQTDENSFRRLLDLVSEEPGFEQLLGYCCLINVIGGRDNCCCVLEVAGPSHDAAAAAAASWLSWLRSGTSPSSRGRRRRTRSRPLGCPTRPLSQPSALANPQPNTISP